MTHLTIILAIVIASATCCFCVWLGYKEKTQRIKATEKANEAKKANETYSDIVCCRGNYFDRYSVCYYTKNPNNTINIHFADGHCINTMYTDADKLTKALFGTYEIQVV